MKINEKLNELYNKNGFKAFTKENLTYHNIYNDIINLMKNEKYKYDIDEYCSKIIDKEGDYIIYISVCNDDY